MNKFTVKFRGLPLRTKQIIGVGLIFFFVVVLPLFIWAILTQKFFFRKEAQVLLTCNQSCTSNSQCESSFCNPNGDSAGGLCRNLECPNDDTCSCAVVSPSPTATPSCQCDLGAVVLDQCGRGTTATCTGKFSCSCSIGSTAAPTPTETPTPTPTNAVGGGTPTPNPSGTPNSCSGTCGSDSNCSSGLVCYQGSCRNGFCPNSTNCSCTTPTPKPTVKPSTKASPTATPTITASATESPTPIATEIAVATPEITPEVTPQPGIFNTLVNNYLVVLGGGLFVIVLLGLLIFMALRRKSKDNIPPINPPTTDNGPTQVPPVSVPQNTSPVNAPPVNFNDQTPQMASMQEPQSPPVTQSSNTTEPMNQNPPVVPPTPQNSA